MNNHLNQISEEREWQIFELLEGNLNDQEAHSLLNEIKQNPAEWKFYQEMKLTYLNSEWTYEKHNSLETTSEIPTFIKSTKNQNNEFAYPNKQSLRNISQKHSNSSLSIGFINKRNLQQWSIAASIILIWGIAFVFKSKSSFINNNPALNTASENTNQQNSSVANSNKEHIDSVVNHVHTDISNNSFPNNSTANSSIANRASNSVPFKNRNLSKIPVTNIANPNNHLKSNSPNRTVIASPEKNKINTSLIRPIQIATGSHNSTKNESINPNSKLKNDWNNPINPSSDINLENHTNTDDREVKIVYASLETDEAYKKEIKSIKKQWLKEAAQELRYGRLPEIRLSTRKQKDTWVPEVGINIASKSVIMHTTLVQR